MKKLLKVSALLMLCSVLGLKAQDKIYKTNGEILEAKVAEVGSTEIKYKVFTNLNGPVYSMAKALITKITYENGSTEIFDGNKANGEPVKRAQNVFVEIGAQGLLLTANYDTRFGNKRNGLGARIGFGAFGGSGTTLLSVPVSLNYLLGNGKNFFEMGVGATYASLSTSDDDDFFGSGNTVIGTMAFMYRLQPIDSGFSFRGGLTPILTEVGFFPFYGISLGYTF